MEKPEYTKVKKYLDDPTNPDYYPTSPAELKALKVVQGQRRYNESKARQARVNREHAEAFYAKKEQENG